VKFSRFPAVLNEIGLEVQNYRNLGFKSFKWFKWPQGESSNRAPIALCEAKVWSGDIAFDSDTMKEQDNIETLHNNNNSNNNNNIIIVIITIMTIMIEGSLEVKLPTIWTDGKQRWEESEKRRAEERRSEKRKSHKKEDAGARKGRKVAKHCVVPMICGSGWSKSRLAKAAGAEPSVQIRDEKLHAVVARSTFGSQNVRSTSASERFCKLRCRKSVRRFGAKHISKSNVLKTDGLGPLLEVEMSKKVHAVVVRSTRGSQTWKKLRGSKHFWTFQMSFCLAGAGDCAFCQK